MSKRITKHILRKWFGPNAVDPKGMDPFELAAGEIERLYNDPLDKPIQGMRPKSKIEPPQPAYLNADENNLTDDGRCRLCEMVWHNCLCSHDDYDDH